MPDLREGDRRAFFEAPLRIYGPDSPFAPLMQSDIERYFDARKNPLFKAGNPFRLFTLHEQGRVIGRICAHIHRASNDLYGLRRACFGFFDVIDDSAAAAMLLGAAERFAREQGADEIAGNFNLTAVQQIGVLTDGFDQAPYTDMGYSGPQTPRLLREHGYQAFFPVTTWELDLKALDPQVLLTPKVRAVLASDAFEWMPINRRHFPARMEDARQAANDAFAANPMYVPVSREEYMFMASGMTLIIDPRISCCVRAGGQAAGVVICIPDLNPFVRSVRGKLDWRAPLEFIRHRLNRRRAVVIYYATARAYQGQGLNSAMLYRVLTALRAAGYEKLGVTWVADENRASLHQLAKLGARRLHRLELFRKAV